MKKIGFFDSGIGGISVMKACITSFPFSQFVYLGDNARAPYGNRDQTEIKKMTEQALTYLFNLGCDVVVVACNTASLCYDEYAPFLLKKFYGRYIIEIINPTVEFAARENFKSIGLLATQANVNSGAYNKLLETAISDVRVYSEPCPMWVTLLENNEHLSNEAIGFLRRHIDNIVLHHDVDAILLACIHYGLVAKRLKILDPNIRIVAQGEIICNYIKSKIPNDIAKGDCENKLMINYLTTGNKIQFDSIASLYMSSNVTSKKVFIDITKYR